MTAKQPKPPKPDLLRELLCPTAQPFNEIEGASS